MEPDTMYNDLTGTASADLTVGHDIESVAKLLKFDKIRFRLVGLSLFGVKDMSVSLICVDNVKSRNGKQHIVKMMIEDDEQIENILKQLHIVLYNKHDDTFRDLKYDEEVSSKEFE